MALGIWLCAAGAHSADTTVPEQAELLKLIRAQVDHAALAPDVRSRTPRPSANIPALGKEDAEKWRQALWAAWVEHVQKTRHPRQVELGDPWTTGKGIVTAAWWSAPGSKEALLMRYGTRVFGQKPKDGWPLYINLHAGGNNRAQNDQCWALTRSQYNIGTGLYLCPRALRDLAESWYDPQNYPLLDRILAEAIALWDVNPDKIYLMGFSMGGWGVMHLAPTLPDRWAAVSASSGAGFVGPTGRAAPDNLRNTPIMIQVGGNDKDYGRQPLSKAFAEALSGFHARDPAGYEVVFKEHAGQGHQINDGDAPGWLARHTRDPLPKRVVWQQPISPPGYSKADIRQILTNDWPQALHYAEQVHWLRNPNPGPYQRIVANREGNTVTIEEAEHIDEVFILLDDRMADLDKPVRVLCGGRELAARTPKRTVDAMIASLVARGDPRLLFSAEVTVKPPDTTTLALEGKPLTAVDDLLRRARHRQAEGRLAEAFDDLDAVVKREPARGPDGCFKEMYALAVKLKDEERTASVARRWLQDLEAVVRKEPARGKGGVFKQMLTLAGATKDKSLQADIIRRWTDADTGNGPLQEQAAHFFMDSPGPQRDVAAALRYAERVVAVRPDGPGAHQLLAFAQQANGKTNESIASIRKAISLLPAKGGEENKQKLEETLKLIERAGTNLLSDVMRAEGMDPDSNGKPGGTNTLSRRVETDRAVIHTDLPEAQARHYANFFDGFYAYFSTNYFPVVQPRKLEILLFAKDEDYKAFDAFGPPRSPFGYYTPGKNTLVVNVERGLGTATHELVHHFLLLGGIDLMLADRRESWINEGIPEFFEKFMGYVADDGTLHISFGYFSNWRFPAAREKIADCTLPKLFTEFDPNLSSAFMLFLHRKGVMQKFVRELQAKGKDAEPEKLLVALYGHPLPVIEREWKAWVAGQAIDGNVNLVPSAFVKTESEWRTWQQENKDRLTWDKARQIYVVRD